MLTITGLNLCTPIPSKDWKITSTGDISKFSLTILKWDFLKYSFVCNRGATFVARRAPSEGALPIPYAVVPSFPRRVQSLHHNTLVAKVWPSGAARNSA